MTSLQDKVVFITGGARGIGAEVARRLRNKGAKLVLTDLNNAELSALAAELGEDHVLTAVADVRDLPAMQAAAARAVERFGGIDVVVANAGIASYGSVLQVDPEAFKRVLDINVLGVFHTVRATLPAVIERRGYVLIVSSLAAYAACPGLVALQRVEGRRRDPRQRAAAGGGPPRRGCRFVAHVLDRHRPGPRHRGRPARLRQTARQLPVAVEQDHHGRQMRGRLRQGHRGPPEPRLLPALGGPVPLAQAGAVHPGRGTAPAQTHRRAAAPNGRPSRRAGALHQRLQPGAWARSFSGRTRAGGGANTARTRRPARRRRSCPGPRSCRPRRRRAVPATARTRPGPRPRRPSR